MTEKKKSRIKKDDLICTAGVLIGLSSKLAGMTRYIEDNNIASELIPVSKDMNRCALTILKAIQADHLIKQYNLEGLEDHNGS